MPPFAGVAVNVSELPAHVGLSPAVNAIETDGVKTGLMIIVIPDEVAVLFVTQIAFDVISHVTTCPLLRDVVVNVGLFVPALVPFIFHW